MHDEISGVLRVRLLSAQAEGGRCRRGGRNSRRADHETRWSLGSCRGLGGNPGVSRHRVFGNGRAVRSEEMGKDVVMNYQTMPGVPGRYFQCQPYRALLSVDACASRWRSRDERSVLCRECRIGAVHAGERPTLAAPATCCARCGRSDLRLIGVRICVSCYNRDRESRIGRNAKGSTPIHARLCRPSDVSVRGGVVHLDRVADPVEAAVLAFRSGRYDEIRPLPIGGASLRVGAHMIPVPGLVVRRRPVQMRLFW